MFGEFFPARRLSRGVEFPWCSMRADTVSAFLSVIVYLRKPLPLVAFRKTCEIAYELRCCVTSKRSES